MKSRRALIRPRGELYKRVSRGLMMCRLLGTLPINGDMELSVLRTFYTAVVSLVSLLAPFLIIGTMLSNNPDLDLVLRLNILVIFSLLLTPILLTAPFKVTTPSNTLPKS
jgi:hypothetical protein